MNILFSCDNAIAKYLTVPVASMCVNHPGTQIDFYILHRDISQNTLRAIRSTASLYGATVTDIVVPAGAFDVFNFSPFEEQRRRWPEATYYFLLANKFLPERLTRALYLDVDTLIVGDIRPFYDVDFEGHIIAGAAHHSPEELERRLKEFKPTSVMRFMEDLINSGVVLLNLEEFRRRGIDADFYGEFIESVRQMGIIDALFLDQGLLNAMFACDAKFVPNEYNDYSLLTKEPRILHAAGHTLKPWTAWVTSVDEIFKLTDVRNDYWWYDNVIRFNKLWWTYVSYATNASEIIQEAGTFIERALQEFEERRRRQEPWLAISLNRAHRREAMTANT